MPISTINTNSIADDAVTVPKVTDQVLTHRNLIINGAMQVAQRSTSETGVTSGDTYDTLDRVKYALNSLGTWTHEQSTNAPSGFSNSYKATCTVGNASPAAGAYKLVYMMLEAQNLQQLGFGTSDAKSLTLSFWVKSNKTGSASVNLQQKDSNPADKQVTKSYTINSADTWEYKIVSFPADTSGVINDDNGGGFQLEWWLNSGSTYTSGSHQTTWTAYAGGDRNSSNLGVGGANNDYWQITGVQLEVGDVATPFEHRSYGDELVRCQRYFISCKGFGSGYGAVAMFRSVYANQAYGAVGFPTEMRATPIVTLFDGTNNTGALTEDGAAHNRGCTANNVSTRGFNKAISNGTGSGNFSQAAGQGYAIIGTYQADAEL
jgi:hypothetical protein